MTCLPDKLSKKTLIYLLADDAKLARIILSPLDVIEFKSDNKASCWSSDWKMKFNLEKSEVLSVTRKKSPIQSD